MSSYFRFLSPTKLHQKKNTNTVIEPGQRFAHFRSAWHAIQKHSTISDKWQRQEYIEPELVRLTTLLLDEETRADRLASKVCLEFALQRGIFDWLATLAVSGPHELTGKVVKTFTSLVEVQDEGFLTHEDVCRSLTVLLKYLMSRTHREIVLGQLVDLLFAICAKVHHFSPLLAMFFNADAWHDRIGLPGSRVRRNQIEVGLPERYEDEFLIFYLLMDNMHQPERYGDFCRTGLLFILDAAKDSPEIQRWVGDSEFPTFLAVGLGSHYSQLGSKLIVEYDVEKDLLLASSQNTISHRDARVRHSSSPEFVADFDRFLVYVAYFQDILQTVTSSELKRVTLDSFRVLFLECILYPALIESSDRDEASVVAVSTYIAAILDVISEPDLVDVMLNYLIGTKDDSREVSRAIRGASLLITNDTKVDLDPELFSLKDFILDNLTSGAPNTKVVSLKLLGSIIRRHWHYVLPELITTRPIPAKSLTIGQHKKEMQILASLVGDISADDGSSQSYENYLRDAMTSLEGEMPTLDELFMVEQSDLQKKGSKCLLSGRIVPTKKPHTLQAQDPTLRVLLDLFSSFFTNTVELNLVLTRSLIDLTICRQRSLAGWLLFSPADAWIGSPGEIAPDYTVIECTSDDLDDDSPEELEETCISEDVSDNEDLIEVNRTARARHLPSWSNFPPFLTLFKTLSAQIRQYKSENEFLEIDLAERRRAFVLNDCEEQAQILIESTKISCHSRAESVHAYDAQNSGDSTTTSTVAPIRKEFAEHFNSTRRSVTSLHTICQGNVSDMDDGAQARYEASTKRKFQGRSLLQEFSSLTLPSGKGEESRQGSEDLSTVNVSCLINNIIIFEEFIKELMSIVQVRRSLFDGCDFV